MSKQHMRVVEKHKKAKKVQAISYLNFKNRIYYLDQMLDHAYWSYHN